MSEDEERYDIALWPRFVEGELPLFIDDMEADSPYEALDSFLRACGLKRVKHAAIKVKSNSLVCHLRYDDVELLADDTP